MLPTDLRHLLNAKRGQSKTSRMEMQAQEELKKMQAEVAQLKEDKLESMMSKLSIA